MSSPLDKQLFRVRPLFVDKVSSNMIYQLLDDILHDGVVSNGEKERISEQSGIRSQKARNLIDTVIQKGDRASSKLIASIQRRDPELYSELGLSCGQSAPPGELTCCVSVRALVHIDIPKPANNICAYTEQSESFDQNDLFCSQLQRLRWIWKGRRRSNLPWSRSGRRSRMTNKLVSLGAVSNN